MKTRLFLLLLTLFGMMACSNDEPLEDENNDSNEQTDPTRNDDDGDTTYGDIFSPLCNLFDISNLPFDVVSINDGREYVFTVPAEGGELKLVQNPDAYVIYTELGEEPGEEHFIRTIIPVKTPVQICQNIYWYIGNRVPFKPDDPTSILDFSYKSSKEAPLELTFNFRENELSEERVVQMYYDTVCDICMTAQNKIKFVQEASR